ncbi:hypothetical protein [Diplodia seriata splipalmivirus 1]|uniref:Uncharacterized protein n=1 Tax=Diplodia seriata splipalmivirus 1 TaxID=2932870 RepID=A0A8T9JJ17_9VIRU|nr:hypothetical protein [Diplodia seriata splipalmivirus 1]
MSGSNQNAAGPSKDQKGRGANPNMRTLFLNPERVPALLPKWSKELGKTLDKLVVEYQEDGVTVFLYGKAGTPFQKTDEDEIPVSMSVAEFSAIKSSENKPSGEDAKFAFRNKFEIRLNTEFPKNVDLGDGSEAALRKAVEALPFSQRRVMLMSNKQFKAAYPNGFAAGANPAA